MIHPLQEYAVMHMFCRGCFFAYGTKMAAAALTRGSLRLDRSRAYIDAELAGGVAVNRELLPEVDTRLSRSYAARLRV